MTVEFLLLLWTVIGSANTILKGAGSGTFSYLITDWLYTYQILKPEVELSYRFTPESDARQELAAAELNFVGLDDIGHILSDSNATDYIYFPVVAEALVPQINLPELDTNYITLDRATLANIFAGKITNWRDTAILQQNEEHFDRLPNATITVVYRSDDNLLTELWTKALCAFSDNWAKNYGVFSVWPTNLTNLSAFEGANGNLGVSSKIIDTPHSIGFVSQSYLTKEPQMTQYSRLVNALGNTVPPFPANVAAAMQGAVLSSQLTANLVNTNNIDAWPIASFLYFLINPDNQDCLNNRELFKFFFWILGGQVYGSDPKTIADGFAPLPQSVADLVRDKLRQVQCGGDSVVHLETQNDMSSAKFLILKIIAGFVFAFCFALNIYHIYTYRTPIISLVYSIVFLIGSVLTLASPFLWLMVPTTNAICQGRLWLTSMGLCIILGTMFSRTWQLREIYKLTKGNTMKQLKHNLSLNNSMQKLARTLSFIFFSNLCLLILWTTVDPFTATLVPNASLEFQAKWHCYSKKTVVWMGVQMICILAILGWGLFVIYQTWSFHQKSMLRETRWVLLTLYNVILNFAAVLPLLSLGGWDDDKQSIGLVVSLEFSAGGIILANLVPKAVSTWKHKKIAASRSASKSSVHGKASTADGSTHGLVKLDVSLRGNGPSPATPISKEKIHHPKTKAKKKVPADEVELKVNLKDSPTLTAIERNRTLLMAVEGDKERQDNGGEESLYGPEPSVSKVTDLRGNNDSLISISVSERPESPTNLHRIFDDVEMTGPIPETKRAPQPSEPTILEEDDEQASSKENLPLRNVRKEATSLSSLTTQSGTTSADPSPEFRVPYYWNSPASPPNHRTSLEADDLEVY